MCSFWLRSDNLETIWVSVHIYHVTEAVEMKFVCAGILVFCSKTQCIVIWGIRCTFSELLTEGEASLTIIFNYLYTYPGQFRSTWIRKIFHRSICNETQEPGCSSVGELPERPLRPLSVTCLQSEKNYGLLSSSAFYDLPKILNFQVEEE